MKDQLEDYIRDNREAFDDAVPSLKVWAGIENALSTQKISSVPNGRRFSLRRLLTIAASVVMLLGLGVVLGSQLTSGNGLQKNLASDNEVFRELEDMKIYYEAEIKNKEAQLINYNKCYVDAWLPFDAQLFPHTEANKPSS